LIDTAKEYTEGGLSVIPIRPDGSKAPSVDWKQYQEAPPTLKELPNLFKNGVGVGVVCGSVSGGLEVLDFESGSPIKEWWELVKEEFSHACEIPVVKTPSGGYHIFFRCSEVEGNQKLAVDANGKVMIETRGEGGYVLAPGSPVACHEKGEYKLVKGSLSEIPTITQEQRQHLLSAAKSFDLTPKAEKEIIRGPKEHTRTLSKTAHAQLLPGDDFNSRASWGDILNLHGWEVAYERNGTTHWRRPGKDKKKGISATTGHAGADLFYNFSSNGGPFESDRSYSKFAAWTVLNHNGDFSQAARELAKEGYGEQEARINKSIDTAANPRSANLATREIVRLSDVTPEKVEFLSYPYIPLGKLTLLDGDPGVGKSTLSLAIAAGVTLGNGIPGMVKADPGNVLVLSCEDGLADTIRPRLDKAGADASKVFALRGGVMTLHEEGLAELSGYLKEYQPRLVIIDPLVGYLGGKVDMHKGNEVRQVTAGLADLAEKFHCSILGIRHLTKGGRDKAIYRGIGSIDFTAAPEASCWPGLTLRGKRQSFTSNPT